METYPLLEISTVMVRTFIPKSNNFFDAIYLHSCRLLFQSNLLNIDDNANQCNKTFTGENRPKHNIEFAKYNDFNSKNYKQNYVTKKFDYSKNINCRTSGMVDLK